MLTSRPGSLAAPTRRLDVVIVNWNSGQRLRRGLEALAASPQDVAPIAKLIVIDNASTDGSAELHDLAASLPLQIVANNENRGFAAACNQGALMGTADALLFLNPDVRICPGALAKALDFLFADDRARVGAVGVKLIGEDGMTQHSCAHFPTAWKLVAQSAFLDRIAPSLFEPHFMMEWDHETTRSVDQVMGAFLMMPRALFESIGGFDERFFVYFEDLDLCLRIKQKGWSIVHFAKASAVHEGQGTTRAIRGTRLFYSWRGRLQYAAKNFSRGGLLACIMATFFLEAPTRFIAALVKGSAKEARGVLSACRLLLGALRELSLLKRL